MRNASITSASLRLVTLFIFVISISFSSMTLAMSNLNGQPASINSFKGKGNWLIVQAWASSCVVCNQEMPGFVKAARSFPNTRVIGVSLDGNKTTAQRFVNKHHVNFPTLLSNTNEFNQYLKQIAGEKLVGTPAFLIFNPQGNLVAMQQGNVPPENLRNFLRKKQSHR